MAGDYTKNFGTMMKEFPRGKPGKVHDGWWKLRRKGWTGACYYRARGYKNAARIARELVGSFGREMRAVEHVPELKRAGRSPGGVELWCEARL